MTSKGGRARSRAEARARRAKAHRGSETPGRTRADELRKRRDARARRAQCGIETMTGVWALEPSHAFGQAKAEGVLDGAGCLKGHALDEPSMPSGKRSEERVSGAAGNAANDDRAVTRRRQRSTGFSELEQCSHRRTRVFRDRSGRGEALRSARSVDAAPEDRICQSRRRPSGRRRCQLQTHIADGE